MTSEGGEDYKICQGMGGTCENTFSSYQNSILCPTCRFAVNLHKTEIPEWAENKDGVEE